MKTMIVAAVAIQSNSEKAATDASLDNDFKNYVVSLLDASKGNKNVGAQQDSSATADPRQCCPSCCYP
jgi:hypothetical protein